jgi:hypothetical protein
VLITLPAPATSAVAEHGVAHNPATDPRRVHPRPDARDRACPLMPEAHRIRRVPLVKVDHLAGEELHVSAADSDSLHVDNDLAGDRHRRRHLLHPALPRPGQDVRAHGACTHRSHYFVRQEPSTCASTHRPCSAQKEPSPRRKTSPLEGAVEATSSGTAPSRSRGRSAEVRRGRRTSRLVAVSGVNWPELVDAFLMSSPTGTQTTSAALSTPASWRSPAPGT